jgi:hypothetical protein
MVLDGEDRAMVTRDQRASYLVETNPFTEPKILARSVVVPTQTRRPTQAGRNLVTVRVPRAILVAVALTPLLNQRKRLRKILAIAAAALGISFLNALWSCVTIASKLVTSLMTVIC